MLSINAVEVCGHQCQCPQSTTGCLALQMQTLLIFDVHRLCKHSDPHALLSCSCSDCLDPTAFVQTGLAVIMSACGYNLTHTHMHTHMLYSMQMRECSNTDKRKVTGTVGTTLTQRQRKDASMQ